MGRDWGESRGEGGIWARTGGLGKMRLGWNEGVRVLNLPSVENWGRIGERGEGQKTGGSSDGKRGEGEKAGGCRDGERGAGGMTRGSREG